MPLVDYLLRTESARMGSVIQDLVGSAEATGAESPPVHRKLPTRSAPSSFRFPLDLCGSFCAKPHSCNHSFKVNVANVCANLATFSRSRSMKELLKADRTFTTFTAANSLKLSPVARFRPIHSIHRATSFDLGPQPQRVPGAGRSAACSSGRWG